MKQISTKSKIDPSKIPKSNKVSALNNKWHFGYLAIAFVVALILWFYVADYDTVVEKTFTVPVEVVYPEKGDLVVESGEGKFVNIRVYGKKGDIKEIKAGDIRAYVDLSNVTKDGEINAEIIVELPNDINLVENDAMSITHSMVMLAIPTSKELTIKTELKLDSTDAAYTLIPECDPRKIEVIGSSSIVERIQTARVSITGDAIVRPKLVRAKIELLDEVGNVVPQTYLQIFDTNGKEIQDSRVEVYVSVETKKELPVTIEFTGGVFTADDAIIKCIPETVTVVGGVEKLDKLDSIKIPVDEKTIVNSFDGVLPLPSLDESLRYFDGVSEAEVHIQLRDIQSVELEISTEDINVLSLPKDLAARLQFVPDNNGLIPEKVKLTIRGYKDSILEIRKSQLDALEINVSFADFLDSESGINAGDIFKSLEVTINFKGLNGVFTTDKYYVSAEIQNAADYRNDN